MAPLSLAGCLGILDAVATANTTIPDFLRFVLAHASTLKYDVRVQTILAASDEILGVFLSAEETRDRTRQWVGHIAAETFTEELEILTHQPTAKFNASHAVIKELEEIDIEDMARDMESSAPILWATFNGLLSVPSDILELQARKRAEYRTRKGRTVGAAAPVAADGIVDGEDEAAEAETSEDVLVQQRKARVRMKQVVCLSILINNRNTHCNVLQTLVGVFLHACNTPESVVNFLSHAGISNAPSTINSCVSSLSDDSTTVIHTSTTDCENAYTYDNVDIDLKHSTSTADQPTTTLIHMTSRMTFRLRHLQPGDLSCSAELWRCSDANPHRRPCQGKP
ncbi:hypothetical protein MIND_00910500 [Mycena indigotica]|uniref:Uncharacterized protein n=1 Tax=Mycena indigotica TaxID=2126181 RepID=A0A8H6SC33_9AGAR|nr:uncharacterized protein MIND_00910500 [Mycena indigotica]KAF7296795.1 hypothetical protein MIND_00910500 [Mycena indigotica]